MKECPKCGLYSPDSAERCDCGYSFVELIQVKGASKKEETLKTDKKETRLYNVCISITCIIGLGALFLWRVLPLPDSPSGQLVNLPQSLAVIGYMFGFAFLGGLLAAVVEALYKLVVRKPHPTDKV